LSQESAINVAIRRSLERLEGGASSYITKRTCFACHHQTAYLAVAAEARSRGFAVSAKVFDEQYRFTLATFTKRQHEIVKGQGVGGGNTMAGYGLFTLQVADHKADETSDALIEYLLLKQAKDGSWPGIVPRPPTEGSRFTNALNALRALDHYGAKATGPRKERITKARSKGIAWLEEATPIDHEDEVHQLRAMVLAKSAGIEEVRKSLLAKQRRDGGWAQLDNMDTDAYATATALIALHEAGMKPTEPPYQRGLTWLLRNQTTEGAWIVQTRSRPIQTFFDNGDPGGKSQFLSFQTTAWATLALLYWVEKK
jgi:hypothetical protein